jgi:ADP-ribose pyrophosphatase
MKPWKRLDRVAILDHSRFLRVENHRVQLPGGRIIEKWPWVITPDFCNVVVITDLGHFVCFRQVKYAVEGATLAPVGGYLEPGEDPLAAAKRETLEETGYEASEWTDLGTYQVDGNRGVAQAHLFLALGARRVTEPKADDLEEQEVVLLTRAQVEAALAAGDYKVLPWATAMALALLALPD